MATSTGLSPAEARVLTALLRVDTPLTGRAVARVTGLTQSTARRALARLREAGLVVAEPAPPSLLHRPNPEHLSMPALVALLRIEEQLRARLTAEVAGWRLAPASVLVFGSVARGEATPTSDLDVLVVRPDAIEPDLASWQAQLADLAGRLHGWTGRPVSVIDLSQRETVRGLSDREPFLVAADRDGWLIAGSALHQLAEPSP